MNYTLRNHSRAYNVSFSDCLLSLVTGFSGASYTRRHWELAKQSESQHGWGHRALAILEAMPVLGGLAALSERAVVWSINKLSSRDSQQNNVTRIFENNFPPDKTRSKLNIDGYGSVDTLPLTADALTTYTEKVRSLSWRECDTMNLDFTWEDMEKLARGTLGLRHVSSPETAKHEALNGFRNGCSLNISPQFNSKSTNFDSDFEALKDDWKKVPEDERGNVVLNFQKGIDDFIKRSIIYDLNINKGDIINPGVTQVKGVVRVVNSCRFSIVNYRGTYHSPTDFDSWGMGLGRYSKLSLSSKAITPLPSLKVEDLDSLNEIITLDNGQYDLLWNRLINCYRTLLIEAIRSN